MKSNWGALNLYNRTTRTFAQVYCMRICFHHFFSSSGTFNPFSHHYLTLFVFFWLWFLYLTIRRTIVCITLPHFLSSSFKVPCVHLSSWRSQYSTFPLVHAYYCFFFSIGNCTQKGAFILLRVHNVKFKMPEFNLWGFSSKAASIDLDMISMF